MRERWGRGRRGRRSSEWSFFFFSAPFAFFQRNALGPLSILLFLHATRESVSNSAAPTGQREKGAQRRRRELGTKTSPSLAAISISINKRPPPFLIFVFRGPFPSKKQALSLSLSSRRRDVARTWYATTYLEQRALQASSRRGLGQASGSSLIVFF